MNDAEPALSDAKISVSDAKSVKTSRSRQLTGLRPPRTLEMTMFERLEKMNGPGIKRMLTVQYRLAHSRRYASSPAY
jgi:DNA polymerase alpha-associated DNA helicase A